MNTKPESKPPEGTLTPSTVSLPSFQELYHFSLMSEPPWENLRVAERRAEDWARKVLSFLAQRGSPP